MILTGFSFFFLNEVGPEIAIMDDNWKSVAPRALGNIMVRGPPVRFAWLYFLINNTPLNRAVAGYSPVCVSLMRK